MHAVAALQHFSFDGLHLCGPIWESLGVDLWHDEDGKPSRIKLGLDFAVPFVLKQDDWQYEEIRDYKLSHAVGAERLRGARGSEAEGGEKDLESCHRRIVPQFYNGRNDILPRHGPRARRHGRARHGRLGRDRLGDRPRVRRRGCARRRPLPPNRDAAEALAAESAASRCGPTCATRRRPTRCSRRPSRRSAGSTPAWPTPASGPRRTSPSPP